MSTIKAKIASSGTKIMAKISKNTLYPKTPAQNYLFNKWKTFMNIFSGKNMKNKIEFIRDINKTFEEIVLNNTDINQMKASVIELAKQLDEIDLYNLVLKEEYNANTRKIMTSFINSLKKRKIN